MLKRTIGDKGEDFAVKYLRKKHYKILERNYSGKFGEIDIIVKDGEYIVFVEVKTRSGDEYGAPCEAVDARKREKYFKVAEEYLLRNGKSDSPCRFDVVEIEKGQINHIINAFYG